jgi:hypothetical protein
VVGGKPEAIRNIRNKEGVSKAEGKLITKSGKDVQAKIMHTKDYTIM